MLFLRLGHKSVSSVLGTLSCLFDWKEASCNAVNCLIEAQVAKELISPANGQQGPEACPHSQEGVWKGILSQLNLEMTAVLAHGLTTPS